MKILCFIDSLGSGGAQRQLVELAKGFKERGHEVSFLTYHEINFFKPDLDQVEIPVTTIVEPNYWKRALKIRRFIRRSKPDAVLAFLEASAFMATVAGFPWRKWKLVVGERSANPNILKSIKKKIFRWFHLFTDYVVANSYSNLKLVKKVNPLLSDQKMKVIYNMVNIPDIDLSNKNSSEKTKIVVAASYRPVKNLDGLIEAVHLLPKDYKTRLRIDWYGSEEDKKYAERMKIKLQEYDLQKVMYLHDATTDIFQIYAEADFVGLFSHYEGFPNTISEAMIIGKPVIASNVSDLPRFITNKKNGYLFDSRNIHSIQQTLIAAIDEKPENMSRMGEENRIIALNIFSHFRIINEYLELLKK